MYRSFGKRLFDFVASLGAIILLSPIYVTIAILIKKDSEGPILFKQKRIGLHQKEFQIYKFRTMVSNAESLGPKSTSSNDTRITTVGKVLRKYSLDELPQFFNVLFGQMSLVGPRPNVKEYVANYDTERLKIFHVKPGITGYAQVNGRSLLTIEEKRDYEIKYMENYSFWVDVKIIIETVLNVVNKKGIN